MTTEGHGWDTADAVLDSAPVGITLVDTDGTVVSVNDRFLELSGYERSAVLGRGYERVLNSDTADTALAQVEQALTTTTEATVELQVRRADGTTFWDRIRIAPVTNEDGTTGFSMFHDDITAQRTRGRSFAALNRFAGRVQDADSVDDICDRAVRAAADILDFDLCSILLRDGEWLVPQATASEAPPDGSRRMGLDQGLAGLTYQTGDPQVANNIDGNQDADPAKEMYRSGISVPVGEYGVFQAVSTDVGAFDSADLELAELLASHTAVAIDRVEREQNLEKQNQRLEAFADVVSHDLRSPLSVLKGSLDLAQRTGGEEHFERATRATERMTQLIDNLLALARSGDDIGDLEAVDLADVSRAAWTHVATADADLAIETDVVLLANELRLTQLLENLFRNSIEHGSPAGGAGADNGADPGHAGEGAPSDGPPLQVRVGTLDDATGFYVSDDGVGIPAAQRTQVLESGYSTADDGTGLGLTISKRVVDGHGWTMRLVESRDGGARFEVAGVELAAE